MRYVVNDGDYKKEEIPKLTEYTVRVLDTVNLEFDPSELRSDET